jgi:hypothetical protein
VRIALEEDRRVFTPLPRSSLKWERCYDKRTAVERVNSRLALVVMLAMAVGRIKTNQAEAMRSLLKAA